MVRNISDSHIFLKKGVQVAQVVSASPVLPTELLPEMEAALGVEAQPEPMSVAARQEKLLEKLNLEGLALWSPGNAVAVRELVLANHDVFALESIELGCTSAIKHEIRIEKSEPFKEWSWSGRRTVCLNAWMKKDLYPLPHIQEALESMAGSAHFLSMDFKSGFWQIKMALESQQYRAFTVGNLGFYEFTHMPFRLCNALATLQHLMQSTLGELNLMYCMIYLDNVIVFGCTEEEHLEHLCVVFERFQEFNLKLKPSKCSFFQLDIIYLAHHILQQGILPS